MGSFHWGDPWIKTKIAVLVILQMALYPVGQASRGSFQKRTLLDRTSGEGH
jgi:hypothetical protein